MSIEIADIEPSEFEITVSGTPHTLYITLNNLSGRDFSQVVLHADLLQGSPIHQVLAASLPSGKKITRNFGSSEAVLSYELRWTESNGPTTTGKQSNPGYILLSDKVTIFKNGTQLFNHVWQRI